MLRVNNLYFDYLDKSVLKNVNFNVSSGEFLHVKGANGSGKTTLLKLIARLLPLNAGEIVFDSNTKFCFVGHQPGVSRALTIKEHYNLELFAKPGCMTFNEVLKKLNLLKYRDSLCSTLSSGQLRKVSLLKLFFIESNLWLLDEPFTAIDEKTSKFLLEFCNKHLKHGGAIIITSHQSFKTHEIHNYKEFIL